MDIVSRVKNILTTPQTEWSVIASEPADPPKLFLGYVIFLAAIPAIGFLIGWILGIGFLGFGSIIVRVILLYIVMVIAPGLIAFIVAKLGPQIGTPDDLNSALKLAVYCFTPFWLAGAIWILLFVSYSLISLVWLLGAVYGVYLLWVGAPIVMRTASDKTPIFVGAAAVISIVVVWLLWFIVGRI
jgi:hypothetical protein